MKYEVEGGGIAEILNPVIQERLVKYADKFGKLAVQNIRKNIREKDLMASRRMYNAVDYQVAKHEDTVDTIVYVAVPYAYYVDKGVSAHFPNLLGIKQWVLDKGISSQFKTTESIAWAIALSLSKRRIPRTGFFDDAIAETSRQFTEEINSL
jgi:hypothetical protein